MARACKLTNYQKLIDNFVARYTRTKWKQTFENQQPMTIGPLNTAHIALKSVFI